MTTMATSESSPSSYEKEGEADPVKVESKETVTVENQKVKCDAESVPSIDTHTISEPTQGSLPGAPNTADVVNTVPEEIQAQAVVGEAQDEIDLEDGELSDGEVNDDENGHDVTPATSTVDGTSDSAVASGNPSATDQADCKPLVDAPAPNKRPRKSTESSDEPEVKSAKGQGSTSNSESSSEEESRSERKRRKKEKERRRKEKKQKRRRDKQEKKEKKRRRHRGDSDFDETSYGGQDSRDMYDNGRSPRRRTFSDERRYGGDYPPQQYGGRSPPGPYDSPPPDPYASPPYESSEDEFSETLYSLVGDELMDPNVSAAEKEAIFKKSQQRIPGLSAGKLKKIMKKRKWREQQARQRERNRRGDRRDDYDVPKEKTQKCKFYAEGKCQKGERCQFSHNFIPAKKMEACKFFLQGYCAKGDMCIYLHSEVPCKYYHTGQKCFNADKCKFSHDPLTDSTRPLLQKAILLEETGTFKAERPSLLGTPPKERDVSPKKESLDDRSRRVNSFDPVETASDDEMPPPRSSLMPPPVSSASSTHIPSIFDLDLKPSAEMQEKLNSGLFEELTAPLEDSDEEAFGGSPKRPKTFYSDTMATPNRSEPPNYSSDDQRLASPGRRNRWGPDLPKDDGNHGRGRQNIGDIYKTEYRGGTDMDNTIKKKPLLPPPIQQPIAFSQAPLSTGQSAPATENISAAAVSLSKILNALRSNAVAATNTSSSGRVDPRTATSDPRMRAADPRSPAPALLPDPRNAKTEASLPAYDPRADPRANHQLRASPPQAALLPTPVMVPTKTMVPELNGKYTHPMEFKLILVHVENKAAYIPAGAESNQDMLRDPRIKKRVQTMKAVGTSGPPSLPDITADLQRFQNAMINSSTPPAAAKIDKSRASADNRTSIDSAVADPRRNSIENKQPHRGQGDSSGLDTIIENGNKPRNATRTALSRVSAATSSTFYNSQAAYDDDEEEDGMSLTIDMPDDDNKTGGSKTAESVHT